VLKVFEFPADVAANCSAIFALNSSSSDVIVTTSRALLFLIPSPLKVTFLRYYEI
jgi:hypothetical protein